MILQSTLEREKGSDVQEFSVSTLFEVRAVVSHFDSQEWNTKLIGTAEELSRIGAKENTSGTLVLDLGIGRGILKCTIAPSL